jgi:hypothetical protein
MTYDAVPAPSADKVVTKDSIAPSPPSQPTPLAVMPTHDLTFVSPSGLSCFLPHSPSVESLYGLLSQVLSLVNGFAEHTNVDVFVKKEGEEKVFY